MLVENRGAVASVHCLLGTTYLTVHFILEAVWVWAVRKVRLGCLCHPPSPSHDSGSPDSKPSVHSFPLVELRGVQPRMLGEGLGTLGTWCIWSAEVLHM